MISSKVILLMLLIGPSQGEEFKEYWLSSDFPSCNVNRGIGHDCYKEVPGVRSLLECLALCYSPSSRSVNLCVRASVNNKGACFHYEKCDCQEEDVGQNLWSTYCVHGNWSSSTRSCTCANETFGERCNKYHQNCDGLITAGYARGKYWTLLDPDKDGKNPAIVRCSLNGSNDFEIYLAKNRGSMTFNRTWDEYVHGFMKNDQNYWVGLKTWHDLLSNGKCDYLDLKVTFETPTISNLLRSYKYFAIGGEETNYAFNFLSSSESRHGSVPSNYSLGDCLKSIHDTPFSSWDRDIDGDGENNCASMSGSGWWYSGCENTCNLLGWGLDNWDSTPSHQRFSASGVDVPTAASLIYGSRISLTCHH